MAESAPPQLDAASVWHMIEGLGSIDTACGEAVFACLWGKDSSIETAYHVSVAGAIHHPPGIVRVTIHREFKQVWALPESSHVALVVPLLQVRGCVDTVPVSLVEHHHPMFAWLIPEEARIARIMGLPFLVRIHHRILLVLPQRHSSIQAVRDALRLAIASIGCVGVYQRRILLAAKA